jgi:hypothetical protein
MDAHEFIHNTNAHSLEELAPFEEQYVAWSMDGKTVLAHAATLAGLYREVDQRGITDYVVGFVPSPDISSLGGMTD